MEELDIDREVKIAEEQSLHNDMVQHANKLIQGFEKLNDNHTKRAIWELFQNAIDVSTKTEIQIELNDDALIFRHNGDPFDNNTLDCLIKQLSSKSAGNNEDQTGQYGTGFITTHSFGRKILLSGSVKLGSKYIPLKEFEIDRTATEATELIKALKTQKKAAIDLIKEKVYSDKKSEFTEFAYLSVSDKQKSASNEALKKVPLILPYVMTLNSKLHKVTIIDKENSKTVYEKGDSTIDKGVAKTDIIIDNEISSVYSLEHRNEELKEYVKVILPIDKNKSAFNFSSGLSKLFLYYPLIGSEDFGVNFIIHSNKFTPTEARDNIHLNSETEQIQDKEEQNRNVLKIASKLIFDFVKNNTADISNIIHLGKIDFKVNSDDFLLNEYYKELKEIWINEFKNFPLVETTTGNIEVSKTVFIHSELLLDELGFDNIYSIINKYYLNIPKKELVKEWTSKIDEWDFVNIEYVKIINLVEKIEQDSHLDKFEDPEVLKSFYKYLIDNGHEAVFNNKKLLPNIKGEFKTLPSLYKSINIPNTLIKIADVILPDIPKSYVHLDFKFKFEFQEYTRKQFSTELNEHISSKVRDDIRLKDVDSVFLASLIDFCKLNSSIDSISIPTKMVKLITRYLDYDENLIELISNKGNDIDIRPSQKKLVSLFLNDLAKKDSDWVEENKLLLLDLLSMSKYDDYKLMFQTLPVFPNQLNELCKQNLLKLDLNIPSEIKDLYDLVIKPNHPIRFTLINSDFSQFMSEPENQTVRSLTEKIESNFFNNNQSKIIDHPFKKEILDIIEKFKSDSNYEKYFPLIYSEKSTILVGLADGEDSFSILSLHKSKIKKLGELARSPNLDKIIELGNAALITEQRYNANFAHKKKIGVYIEDLIRLRIGNNIEGLIVDIENENELITKEEQGGQDIIIYYKKSPLYYIEVKSRWDPNSVVSMSKLQLERASLEMENYALCSVDMTKYTGSEDKYKVESVESIKHCIRFVNSIGKSIKPLIESNLIAEKDNIKNITLSDYRGTIPQTIINNGYDLDSFTQKLINIIKIKTS
ncbi:sacsin N-terminal ATP-binding-like domain-containing protein [Olleya sp. R77988]|uniref:sacsin N-terminal ATP-binding-like domain-containing protein n=1 Tax=Olleya sp. R77988 TaxID=3093875 RepID=UPI0037CB8BBB